MRVGFDARWYNDSGVGIYVAELLRALAPLRDCELVVYEDPGNLVPGLDGLPLERVPVVARKYSLSGMLAMGTRCREDRLDVFHSPFYPVPMFGELRKPTCPVVVTIHDLIPFLFSVDAWPKRQLVKAGYRRAARVAAEIITVSQHSAEDVVKILRVPAAKITSIHNAVSPVEFREESSKDEETVLRHKYGLKKPYVVAASAHNWQTKNLKTALLALEEAKKICEREFQTVVYGPPDGLRGAGGETQWRGLDLVCTGHVPARELAILFRHAEAFIFPPLYEGFGLPVLEAMACGCPVVTSNGGSLKEVAGDGAQVCDPMDVRGMAEAMVALLQRKELRERWRAAGLRRVKEFSWNAAAQQTVAVYHRAYQNWAQK